MSVISNGRDDIKRHKLSEVAPLAVPYNIQLEPSDICNFSCEYCVHSTVKADQFQNTMCWDAFKKIVQQLQELASSYKIINLIGYGEPLIYKNIANMVSVLKWAQLTERIEITTNASLLTPEKSDELIKAGLTRLIISLQGLNEEKYKKICGFSLNFVKFREQIKYFYEHRGSCKLHVKIADTALSDGEEDKFYNLFGSICDDLYIEHIIPVYKDVDYSGKVKRISSDNMVTRYGYEFHEAQVCPQPFYQMFIKANGDVAPCCMYPSPFILGNIYEESLKEIWNGRKHRIFMEMQLKKQREQNAICRGCINPSEASHPLDNIDADADLVLMRVRNLARNI